MSRRLHAACASSLALATALSAGSAFAAPDPDEAPPSTLSQVIVTATKSVPELDHLPTTTESVTAAQVADTINSVTIEDALRYLPNVLIRQRHIGDNQDPITTRTSGVGASARSLIYADGVLLSALIGNNNTTASPKWGLVTPEAVSRIDVLYGPFAAAYPGNSIGSVIEITTKAPTGFEASAQVQGAGQFFKKYGDDRSLGTSRITANVGDRLGRFAFRASYNHLESDAQPLTYATATIPAAASAAGTPVTGAFLDANRLGVPIQVLGGTAIAHQVQDSLTTRLTYKITPTLEAAYTAGFFRNDENDTVNSYLRDASGASVYAGAVNIGGRAYTLANSLFSNSVYALEEDQLAQGLSLSSHTGGLFDFEVVGTRFDILKSRQRIPSGALPAAFTSGPGSVVSLNDTGWMTFDAKGTFRPFGETGPHLITFGAHADAFRLKNPRYALSDWIAGSPGATTSFSRGRTEQQALWAQDIWRLTPTLTATLGGRYEHWDAYDGLNFSAAPALNKAQPTQGAWRFSPKGVLAWKPLEGWTFKGSVGVAYRFPTVQELYQAVTVGPILATPNPNLRPEHALSGELSAERAWSTGKVRLSFFGERIDDALISQTGQIATGPNTTAPASFIQNVDRVRTRGVEVVASQDDVLIKGLELSGWITYVDAKTVRDAAVPAAVGKDLPQLPRLRASAVATYRPTQKVALTLGARYSDRSFGTIDNTDTYANTYQGFGGFFVMDAHARYQVTPHISAELGVDNLNDARYFLFHPFPGRTVIGSLKYTY
ncbi:TonB-dependent receptor [soil metagenome]